jgi:tetratricopeptide (TPR) repeat protein
LLAAALAAFGGSLFAGFHLDDYAIFQDPLPRAGSVLRVWPHPLTHFIDWLNFQVAGQEPLGYHAVNLLLHLGAVLLAYECLRRVLSAKAAVLAAAIFAVHPLQAEAVDYVAARGAIIAALLCFAALLAWISGLPWIALAAFAGALLADERCALFPVIWLMVGWGGPLGPHGTPSSRSSGVPGPNPGPEGTPQGVRPGTSPTVSLALALVLGIAAALLADAPAHAGSYALAVVALRFLRLFVLPWGFTIDPDVHEPLWLTIAAAIGIVAVVAWRWRKLSVDSELSWLLIGLLLLIPGFSANPAADPRAYVPVFAFAAAAGLLLARVPGRALGTGAVVILTLVSVGRTYVWMSEERLWREAVRRAPGRVEPKIQLARQLRAADALELLNRAREQAPYNSEIPAEIGKVLLDEQQYEGAVDELSRAVALNPSNALAFNNRGVALAALAQFPAAAADFHRALALDPHLEEARENLKRLGVR